MEILTCKDYSAMSQKAAEIIASQIKSKPDSALGLATGSTPIKMYDQLVEMHKDSLIDFSQIKTFNLDEYCELPQSNPQSYYYFMEENFFRKVNLKKEQIYIPNGVAEDLELECVNYDNLIDSSGGIDLQVLGIGNNSHIGFNEPKDYFEKNTHITQLDESTLEANARFFDDNIEAVPKKAITMGIGSIFKSKKIMLLASGESKAKAIYNTLYGKITPTVPSSILNLHPNVIIILDEKAASLLDEQDFKRV